MVILCLNYIHIYIIYTSKKHSELNRIYDDAEAADYVWSTCWSWVRSNRTSPSKWVGLGSPLAACSVYGDLTCSVHTVNDLCMFNCQCHFYLCNRGPYVRLAFVPNMLSSWNKDIIITFIILINQFLTQILMRNHFCAICLLHSVIYWKASPDDVMTLILFKFLYRRFYDQKKKKKKKKEKKEYSKCSKNLNTMFFCFYKMLINAAAAQKHTW